MAIDELPVTAATLGLRILGRDQTQQQAIAEGLSLPRDDLWAASVLQSHGISSGISWVNIG